MINLKIKKVHPDAVIPKYAHASDACFDLVAVNLTVVEEKKYGYIEYDTGLQMAIPDEYVGLIFPRSSISNTGLLLSNCVGVIDPAYRGNIKARFKWIKDSEFYKIGERCCQMMLIPRNQVNFQEFEGDWEKTERDENGFGSSGK